MQFLWRVGAWTRIAQATLAAIGNNEDPSSYELSVHVVREGQLSVCNTGSKNVSGLRSRFEKWACEGGASRHTTVVVWKSRLMFPMQYSIERLLINDCILHAAETTKGPALAPDKAFPTACKTHLLCHSFPRAIIALR